MPILVKRGVRLPEPPCPHWDSVACESLMLGIQMSPFVLEPSHVIQCEVPCFLRVPTGGPTLVPEARVLLL